MCRLKYSEFFEEVLKQRGMKKTELAQLIGAKPEQVYEFLEGKHCPHAAIAQAVEVALGFQNLDPAYYGWGEAKKP